VTLYTIGAIKDIPGVRKYVAVDGGMTDNPRPALYQAKYEAASGEPDEMKNRWKSRPSRENAGESGDMFEFGTSNCRWVRFG